MQSRFKPLGAALTGLLLVSGLTPSARAQSRVAQSTPVSGKILVRWKSQRAPLVLASSTEPARWQQSALRSRLSAALPGSNLKQNFQASGWSLVTLPAGQSVYAARVALAKTLGAANVTPVFRRYISKTPNDPSFTQQYQWTKISAPSAWEYGTGSRDVVVAVVDTGIDLVHPDLVANLWKNRKEIPGNNVDDDKNGYVDDVFGINGIDIAGTPQDDEGHGTHCAGNIGAVGNNSKDVTGGNWSVQLMALKCFKADGSGDGDAIIRCFEYAIAMKKSGVNLKVMSNSYGGPSDDPAQKAAYDAAQAAGILQVSAAGNENTDNDATPNYPSNYGSATSIAVAASDQSDGRADFSNYGAKTVDLAAPGVAIPSTKNGGGIENLSGTSMSTPIVAGAAALLMSLDPDLTIAEVKARLLETVDKVPAFATNTVTGGRLNLGAAAVPVRFALNGQVYRLKGTARVPLAGAVVTATVEGKEPFITKSGSNGSYSFPVLRVGTYAVTAALKGYTFKAETQVLPPAVGSSSATLDFEAVTTPAFIYSLSGTARDTSGAPVQGVSIYRNIDRENALAVTDARGKYFINELSEGTYTLEARGGETVGGTFRWTATPSSIALPTKTGEKRGEVNFRGVLNDKSAPIITITAPAEGAKFAPGNQVAKGLARDISGVETIYLQLTRFINQVPSYYNFRTRQWVADRASGTILARSASGKEAKWDATLPFLIPASYSLRVYGRDVLGNVSRGESDAYASFEVIASPAAASAPSAGNS